MAGPTKFVGASVKRVEDPRFLLGRGRYIGDLSVPHMAEMALVRSPHAHARIRAIDTQEARQLPGVIVVLTGADLRDKVHPLRPQLSLEIDPRYKTCDWYGLTWDKARHVGDPVALIIAENRYIAEDAAELVVVDYEPLAAVVDPEQALTDSTNLVHEEWGGNIQNQTDFQAGGPDGVFANAHIVVRERFRTNRHHALPLETRGCLATFEAATGDLTLWTSSQMPHYVRTALAERLQHPENKIRVIAPNVGGGFGLKAHFFVEEALTAAAAMHAQRPVRWLEDRRESFIGSLHAKDQVVDAELALAADGTVLGARLRAIGDIGAYNAAPWTSGFEVVHMASNFVGPYRIPNYAYSATSVASNKATVSTFRGVGIPISTFVMEGLLDRAARALEMDPVEIRRRNLIRKEEFPYQAATGAQYDIGGYHECLEKAVEMIDYAAFRQEQAQLRARGVYRGIGVSCYNEATGLGSILFHMIGSPNSSYESANLKFDPSGHLTIFCGTHSHGQAHETVYAQIAADELAIPPDRITVRLGDTTTPFGWGTWGSRAAVSGGGAVLTGAQKLAAKVRRVAGHLLEVSADDVELIDGQARVKGAPTRSITIAELAKRVIFTDASQLPPGEQPGLDVTHYYDTPPATYSNATHIAIVEVDLQTGGLTILRYVVAEDCGRIINPMVVDGQVQGGVVQGLGGALLEHLVYDENGQLLATSFMDYLLPTAADVPAIEIAHIETPSPLVAGGFKGAGEGGAVAPFATIANAAADALASFAPNVSQLPLSPERVYRFAYPTSATAA